MNNISIRNLSLLVCICLTTISYPQSQIAVVDFSGYNIAKSDVFALTNRLRNEIYKTGKASVIERELMEEILEEQSIQQSGCTSNECLVEIGMLINVNRIIGGSISKVGSVYTISARVIDVETGVVLSVCDYDHIGLIDDLLVGGMKNVAYQLMGLEISEKASIFDKISSLFDLRPHQQKNNNIHDNRGKKSFKEFLDTTSTYDVYKVIAYGTQLRVGPDTSFAILRNLSLSDNLLLIDKYDEDWYKVSFYNDLGYVYSGHIRIDSTENYNDYFGWKPKSLRIGDINECIGINRQYDNMIDNFIRIRVGKHTDVIVKLVEESTSNCIREVYVPKDEEYYMRHIPIGYYYLKIAYGQELMTKKGDDFCFIKFIRDVSYEQSTKKLFFTYDESIKDKQMDTYISDIKTKSYELFLDKVSSQQISNLPAREISYKDFEQ